MTDVDTTISPELFTKISSPSIEQNVDECIEIVQSYKRELRYMQDPKRAVFLARESLAALGVLDGQMMTAMASGARSEGSPEKILLLRDLVDEAQNEAVQAVVRGRPDIFGSKGRDFVAQVATFKEVAEPSLIAGLMDAAKQLLTILKADPRGNGAVRSAFFSAVSQMDDLMILFKNKYGKERPEGPLKLASEFPNVNVSKFIREGRDRLTYALHITGIAKEILAADALAEQPSVPDVVVDDDEDPVGIYFRLLLRLPPAQVAKLNGELARRVAASGCKMVEGVHVSFGVAE